MGKESKRGNEEGENGKGQIERDTQSFVSPIPTTGVYTVVKD